MRVAAAVAFAVALASLSAQAAFEPDSAQSDVDAIRSGSAYSFCEKPHLPLSGRARALCPHASEIARCEGFAAACAAPDSAACAPTQDKPPPRAPSPGLARLLRFLGGLAQSLVWVLVLAVVIAVLGPILRALLRARRDRRLADPEPEKAPEKATASGELPVLLAEEALLERADAHARAGENAVALQLYLAASLRALDRRGALRLSKHRTNGEYVRSCTDPSAAEGLRELVYDVDRVQFGHEDATAEGVARAARSAQAIVRALGPTVLALAFTLALTLACGCARPSDACFGPTQPGDDPAGGELFHDLLLRQGIALQRLDRALASIPAPAPGDPPSALLVDGETTDLDEETRAHLVAWVEGGGILVFAGSPSTFPAEFGAVAAGDSTAHEVKARTPPASMDEEDQDDDNEPASDPSPPPEEDIAARGTLAQSATLSFSNASSNPRARAVAWLGDGATYALSSPRGSGTLWGIASDELLTNAGLARRGNAATLAAILGAVGVSHFWIAEPDDGVSPPASPIAALARAGLGLGLAHAAVAVLVLFLAAGARLSRPRPASPPARRAFAEHVEAVGALYARTGSAPHALSAYARFAEERLRARMPSGTSDVAAFLASRSQRPIDECRRIWVRATAPNESRPRGDELDILKELGPLYAAATSQKR